MNKNSKWSVISIGFFANGIINTFFDFLLYPAVLLNLGTVVGGVIMTVLSIILNFSLIIVYSFKEIDWFGFEELRLKRDREEDKRLFKFILNLGHWPAFIILSLYDPFLAFVYAKGKRKSHKHFSFSDWIIFTFSHIIGNGGWILLLTGVITIVKNLIYNYY